MTLRELINCVSTDNHVTYKLTKFGYNHTLDGVHWEEIGRRYKDSEVWIAYPVEANNCAVKKWHIVLKWGDIMARKFSSLKDLYATLFFAGDARFDLYSSSGLIRAGCRWSDIHKSYKGAQVATLWIKELDFTGCVMDCEVHFK